MNVLRPSEPVTAAAWSSRNVAWLVAEEELVGPPPKELDRTATELHSSHAARDTPSSGPEARGARGDLGSALNFRFLADPDRTRYSYLRLRRLREAIKDAATLEAAGRELAVPPEDMAAPEARAKLAALERHIDRLRGAAGSLWGDVAAPEVLAAAIFRAGLAAPGPSRDLFTPAAQERAVVKPALTWLEGAGFVPYKDLPGGLPVNALGYQKGMLSRLRVVGLAVTNDLRALDDALAGLPSLVRSLSAMYVACTPALAAAYLSSRADAATPPRWNPKALEQRLGAAGIGLLLIEGDAVAQAMLPKERTVDATALEDVISALRARASR
jgi:hypothetical protein